MEVAATPAVSLESAYDFMLSDTIEQNQLLQFMLRVRILCYNNADNCNTAIVQNQY